MATSFGVALTSHPCRADVPDAVGLHDAITAPAAAVRTVTPAAAWAFAVSRARAWVHKLCVHTCARVLAREIDCHIVRFFYEGNLQ